MINTYFGEFEILDPLDCKVDPDLNPRSDSGSDLTWGYLVILKLVSDLITLRRNGRGGGEEKLRSTFYRVHINGIHLLNNS